MASSDVSCTYGTINFLARNELFEVEKPYSMRYPPQGQLKQRNLITETHKVKIQNLRNSQRQFEFEKCGFDFMQMPTKMHNADFDDVDKIGSIYAPEICEALKKKLNAKHVHVMDYALRKRHQSFPISTGTNYENDQPTSIVHIDFTLEEAERMLHILYGSRAKEVTSARWQVINVWRSISGPVQDWPLVVCDAETFDQSDAMPADIVYPQWVTENLQIHHNPEQKWYYMPDLEADMCWIFKSADSVMPEHGQCPHSAFADPKTPPNAMLRESIDCRCFVMYADLDDYPPPVGRLYGGATNNPAQV